MLDPEQPLTLGHEVSDIDVSVVVPLYNEEESILPLYRALKSNLDELGGKSEIVLVDDGSADDTFRRAEALAADDGMLRVIKLRRNAGQTPAMMAGIEHARGSVIITMDGDLQNDPADIRKFLEKLSEGYDFVIGWRYRRKDKFFSRKLPSIIANRLIGWITGVPVRDNGCSLKAYRSDVVRSVPLYSEMHRFIPAMLSLSGARFAEIRVRHHARQFGESKYGLSRIYKVLIDLLTIKTLTAYGQRLLQGFFVAAVVMALPAAGGVSLMVFDLLSGADTPVVVPMGITLLFASTSFFLLLCGIFAELVLGTGTTEVRPSTRLVRRNQNQ